MRCLHLEVEKIGSFDPKLLKPKCLGSAGLCLRSKTCFLGFSDLYFNRMNQLRYHSSYFWGGGILSLTSVPLLVNCEREKSF